MKRVETDAGTMETTIGQSPVGFHVSLNVSDLARSVEFYRKVFGASPTKERADYAKFETKNPPVTLSLEPGGSVGSGGALNHIGFRLASAKELVDLQRRLEMAGLGSQRENGVECCYSRQTKFWLRDPDQTLWEFYVLEDDGACCGSGIETTAKTKLPTIQVPTVQPIATRRSASIASNWEHSLDAPFPIPLPFDDGALTEVRLRGTFNVPVDGTTRESMFAEILRVLSANGRVVLHQLTADRPLTKGFLSLPGPATVVKEAPVDRDVLAWVEDGGFEQIRLLKLSGSPTFEIGGVELRELIVEARKPAGEDRTDEVTVVYKGPYRDLVDDAGRVFRRGERVAISAEAWNAIRSGPLEELFVRLKDSPVVSRHGST